MGKIKRKKKKKSNLILIINILSLIFLLLLIFLLIYDLKNSQREWKTHLDNGDIYAGKGEWIQTKPLINTKDAEPPISTITYKVVNDPLSGIQINIDEGD